MNKRSGEAPAIKQPRDGKNKDTATKFQRENQLTARHRRNSTAVERDASWASRKQALACVCARSWSCGVGDGKRSSERLKVGMTW